MRRWALLVGASLCLAAGPSAATDPASFVLPNGLRVVLLEDHATPLVRARLILDWDRSDEAPGLGGTACFVGAFLARADAGSQSRVAFERAAADQGAQVEFLPRVGRWEWTAEARSTEQEAALRALATLVTRPVLEGPLVERLRLGLWRGLESAPGLEAFQQGFLAALQGQQLLTEPTLGRVGLEDLDRLRRRVLQPTRAVLGLSGDLTPAQARTLALLHLGAWGSPPPEAQTPPPDSPALVSHREGSPEAWLGIPLAGATPRERAASELLCRWLEVQAPGALRGGVRQRNYLLLRAAAATVPDLPGRIQALRERRESLQQALTPAALEAARRAWLHEEALLPLHPRRHLERALERTLGNAARPEEVRAVTWEEVQAFFRSRTGHLLVQGVGAATVAEWVKGSPALGPWAKP